MKRFSKILTLCTAIFMVLQIVLPTISQAIETIKLNIQFERPYSDNDGDGIVGNDVFSLVRQAIQTVFKIGKQDEDGKLNFDDAYYCLRGGLGFGSTEEILAEGVDYIKLTELNNKTEVIKYFKDIIGYEMPEENYNAICWIAENMYLPKSEYANELKEELLENAGITSSLLTDDDIEVVQQIALWYFTNYDENGEDNSVSLDSSVDLANLLQINKTQPNNDLEVSYNKNRAKQINKLYKYFIENAVLEHEEPHEKIPTKLELDKTLNPEIKISTIPGTSVDAFVVGPFKINEIQKGNIEDNIFSYSLKYKINNEQQEWSTLEIDNMMGTAYLSDAEGTALENRTKEIDDMIGAGNFYITVLKDVLEINEIVQFSLDISYDYYYYNTETEILIADADDQPVLKVNKQRVTDPGEDSIVIAVEEKEFDLSLRKYITKVNDIVVENTRIPQINYDLLDAKESTTAEYKHRKEPVEVKTGDLVTYELTIYNEGEIDGRATKIVDQLPTGLEFVEVKSGNYELESYDEELNRVTLKEKTNNTDLKAKVEGENLNSTIIEIICKVTAKVSNNNQILTNVAWIAEDYNTENTGDRDSKPDTTPDVNKDNMENYTGKDNKEDLTDSNYYYKGQEDDDDFEKLIIKGVVEEKEFDLSLRKYISNIERNGEKVEIISRLPKVDTTPLQSGKTTANYVHPKNVLTVKQGDIITYKLRVYNEGELDGYASEITDYIPEGLGLLVGYSGNDSWSLKSNVNSQPLVGENGIFKTEEQVPTNGIFKDEDLSKIEVVTGKDGILKIVDAYSLKDELIKKYGSELKNEDLYQISSNSEKDGLFYQEIEVTCIVLAPNTYEGIITNIAEISADKAVNENGEEVNVEDRDSKPANVFEDEKHTPGSEENGYTPGEQDDDDFEPVQLKYFDLALRKFITGVNDEVVDTRIPEFYIDEEGNYIYKHDKTPVEVVDNDNVTYTIRVFNEGTIAGYVQELEDDIPEGLIFLPDDETNKEYGWKMYYYDEDNNLVETDKQEEAKVIRTDYLSEKNGKDANLLTAFNKDTMEEPDYKDIKVVFKVSQNDIPEENEDGIIINKAHITEDSDYDEDSIPDKWNDGEDDQDKEYVYVQKFDLSIFKWVTQTIVTVDGKTTKTETGFKPNIGKTEAYGDAYRKNNEEEPIASVTIDKKKLKSTEVKFVYDIKVVNEGDIAGYATEITDYIPKGLKFVEEDNPLWTLTDGNKITTRALETKLLEPGESAEIQVVFTWINDSENLGLKTNIVAITEDYNDKGIADEDSTPGNEDIPNYNKEQEDDDDFALVILTLKTGEQTTYTWLILVVITIIASGAILVKKYVL